jgi:hypothetical protein
MMTGVVDKSCFNVRIWNFICFGLFLLARCFGECTFHALFGCNLLISDRIIQIRRGNSIECSSMTLFPAVYVDGITFGQIIAPSEYTALTEDFQLEFQTSEVLPLASFSLKISFLGPPPIYNIDHINFITDFQSNSTRVKVPCTVFTRAGSYLLRVESHDENVTSASNGHHLLEHKLDVRWPSVRLSVTHETIETYPIDPVSVLIEYSDIECPMDTLKLEARPTFELELTYCGTYSVACDSSSVPANSTFPIKTLHGFQRRREIPLNCEHFGLAGNYVLHLKPLPPLNPSLAARAFIKVIPGVLTRFLRRLLLSILREINFPLN